MEQLDHSEIVDRVQAAKPDILLVALGNPKQEKWIWMHRKRLGVPVAMGVGGSFEIIVGDMRRAPKWIQRCGLEWAMRFVQEPSRLGPRYLRDIAGLGRRLPMTLLAGWLQRPYLGPSHVTTVKSPQVLHVYLHGKLSSKTAHELDQAAAEAIAMGVVMVVHLQGVMQVTAAGLGALMGVRRTLLDAGLTLSLADLKLKHRFLLHAWCAQPLFDEWESTTARGQSKAKGLEKTSGVDLHGERKVVPAETRARG
jgi:N-acetylglucosaminyldiphosphoundecaprenol N-acetyl-beta-D-mannosaminyltransferase